MLSKLLRGNTLLPSSTKIPSLNKWNSVYSKKNIVTFTKWKPPQISHTTVLKLDSHPLMLRRDLFSERFLERWHRLTEKQITRWRERSEAPYTQQEKLGFVVALIAAVALGLAFAAYINGTWNWDELLINDAALQEQLTQVDQQIKENPKDAKLYNNKGTSLKERP